MPSALHTRDLVLELRQIQQEQHLSPQNIYDMVEESGHHVALNSIKRVFSEGSEDLIYRYQDTLDPIAKVLRKRYANHDDAGAAAMQADLAVKDELISRLERELTECREEHARRTEFLLKQIELKDQRIDRLHSRVDEVMTSNRELLQQLHKLLDRCDNCSNRLPD